MFIHTLRALTLAAALPVFLSACGGGSKDPSLAFDGLAVSPSSVTLPGSGAANLTLSFSTQASDIPSGAYQLEGHIFLSSASDKTPSDSSRFAARACSSAFPCNATQALSCTLSSSGVLSCSTGSNVTLSAGAYTIVGRACYYDDKLSYICTTRSTTLTVNANVS